MSVLSVDKLSSADLAVTNPTKYVDGQLWDYTTDEIVLFDSLADGDAFVDIQTVYVTKSRTYLYFAFEGLFNYTATDAAMGMFIDLDQTADSGWNGTSDSWGRSTSVGNNMYFPEINFYVWDWQPGNFGFARYDGAGGWEGHDDWDAVVMTARNNYTWEMAIPFTAFESVGFTEPSTIAFSLWVADNSAFEIAPDDPSVTPNDRVNEGDGADIDVITNFAVVELDTASDPFTVDGDLSDWTSADLIIDDTDDDSAPSVNETGEIKEVYAKATMAGIYFGINGDFNSTAGDGAFGAFFDVDQVPDSGYNGTSDSWGRGMGIANSMYFPEYNFYAWDFQENNFGFARWNGASWGNHDDWDPYLKTAHTNTSWEMFIPYAAFEDFDLDVWSKIAFSFWFAGNVPGQFDPRSATDIAPNDPAVAANDDLEGNDTDLISNFAVLDLETTAITVSMTADGDDADWPINADMYVDADDPTNAFGDFHNMTISAAEEGIAILLKGDFDGGAFDGGWHLAFDVDQFMSSGKNQSESWIGGLTVGSGNPNHYADFWINMWDLDTTNRKFYTWNGTHSIENGDLGAWDLAKSADEDTIEIIIPFALLGLDGRYPTQFAAYAVTGSNGGYNDTLPMPVHGNFTDAYLDWFNVIIPSVMGLRNQFPEFVAGSQMQTPTPDVTADDKVNLKINATDADGSIAGVKVYYDVDGTPLEADFNALTGDQWNVTIGPFVAGSFVQYYIEAADDKGATVETGTTSMFILPSGAYVPSRTIDGDIADWTGLAPLPGNYWVTSDGVFIFHDPMYDDTGADLDGDGLGDYIYNDPDDQVATDGTADVLQIRILEDAANVFFLITVRDLTLASRVVFQISNDINSTVDEWGVGGNEIRLPSWTSGNGFAVSLAHEDQTFVVAGEVNTLFWAGGGEATTDAIPVKMIAGLGWEVAVPKATMLKWGVDFRDPMYMMGSAFRSDNPQEFSAHEVNDGDDGSGGSILGAQWADPDTYDLFWLDEAAQVAELNYNGGAWKTLSSDANAVHFWNTSSAWMRLELADFTPPGVEADAPVAYNFMATPAQPDDLDTIDVSVSIGDATGIDFVTLNWGDGAVNMTYVGFGVYTATIGPFAYDYNLDLQVRGVDTFGNMGSWLNYPTIVIASSDVIAPLFGLLGPTFTPDAPEVGDTVTVSIDVTDAGVGVAMVSMYWSIDGSTFFTESMTAGAGDSWTADLPSDATSAAGIVYVYFYAEDAVGNSRYDADSSPYEIVVTAPVETTTTSTTEVTTTDEESTTDEETTTTEDDGGTPGFGFLSVIVLVGAAVVVSRRRRR